MATFVPIGMRVPVSDGLAINTCAGNDTSNIGNATSWVWTNPTNRAVIHKYEDIEAVSVECLWQGTKIRGGGAGILANVHILAGDWRKGKGKKPIGAYAGFGKPLITTPGAARRAIYLPAFERLIRFWLDSSHEVRVLFRNACRFDGNVYLRDHDTGQGIDRNGPMSHAWLLSTWLNDGKFDSYR